MSPFGRRSRQANLNKQMAQRNGNLVALSESVLRWQVYELEHVLNAGGGLCCIKFKSLKSEWKEPYSQGWSELRNLYQPDVTLVWFVFPALFQSSALRI